VVPTPGGEAAVDGEVSPTQERATQSAVEPIRGYARSGKLHIAYQVLGAGPPDMVHLLPFGTPVEVGWERPQIARWWTHMGSFSRSIIFDQRGVGSSDRSDAPVTVEDQVADLHAVIEAIGAEQIVLAAYSQASPVGIVYAERHPDRVSRLILYAATARVMRAPDYPEGRTVAEAREWVTRLAEGWGNGGTLDQGSPTVANDPAVREWVARAERTIGSPRVAVQMAAALGAVDVREQARALRVPTLVMHRSGDPAIPVAQGRWLAENIPHARWVELDGVDHAAYFGDMSGPLEEIEEWVTGTRPAHRAERLLTTLLFTDIAGSTERAATLGDSDWRNLLERHHAELRRELRHQGGIELNSVGDGFLAQFTTATSAVAAALAIRRSVALLGLQVRAGIHTTECERMGSNVGGLGVHIAARISALAQGGQILVSRTVADVLLGSGTPLIEGDEHILKGVPGLWRVFEVDERRRVPRAMPDAGSPAAG
jgi:class 3 adenylate cyclase/pimeloyl-ACP methyl ester carboxylesterase